MTFKNRITFHSLRLKSFFIRINSSKVMDDIKDKCSCSSIVISELGLSAPVRLFQRIVPCSDVWKTRQWLITLVFLQRLPEILRGADQCVQGRRCCRAGRFHLRRPASRPARQAAVHQTQPGRNLHQSGGSSGRLNTFRSSGSGDKSDVILLWEI